MELIDYHKEIVAYYIDKYGRYNENLQLQFVGIVNLSKLKLLLTSYHIYSKTGWLVESQQNYLTLMCRDQSYRLLCQVHDNLKDSKKAMSKAIIEYNLA